jgi:hypothetical protein
MRVHLTLIFYYRFLNVYTREVTTKYPSIYIYLISLLPTLQLQTRYIAVNGYSLHTLRAYVFAYQTVFGIFIFGNEVFAKKSHFVCSLSLRLTTRWLC